MGVKLMAVHEIVTRNIENANEALVEINAALDEGDCKGAVEAYGSLMVAVGEILACWHLIDHPENANKLFTKDGRTERDYIRDAQQQYRDVLKALRDKGQACVQFIAADCFGGGPATDMPRPKALAGLSRRRRARRRK